MEKNLSEVDILNEMVAPDGGDFPPEGAKALLALQFTPKAVSRMNELAERNRLDALSSVEKAEMEKYMRVGNFLSVIKAKARLSLSKQTSQAS
jgi:uncharacterized protein YnzC (UPF0291/DUF896 family)